MQINSRFSASIPLVLVWSIKRSHTWFLCPFTGTWLSSPHTHRSRKLLKKTKLRMRNRPGTWSRDVDCVRARRPIIATLLFLRSCNTRFVGAKKKIQIQTKPKRSTYAQPYLNYATSYEENVCRYNTTHLQCIFLSTKRYQETRRGGSVAVQRLTSRKPEVAEHGRKTFYLARN